MQGRATLSMKRLSALVCSFSFLFATPFSAQAGEKLTLPKKVADLKTQSSDDSTGSLDLQALKSSIKLEILEELRGPAEKQWHQTGKAKLNFLELSGYFRTRGDAFNHCDLGTYIPALGYGTSQCPPPSNFFPSDPANPADSSGASWLLSSDLRFRLDPTLNVSEDIRVRGRIDFLDNVVLGSTPGYMTGAGIANPSDTMAVLSMSQNSPLVGVNSSFGPIAVKRLWAEVDYPFGEVRFGRMPLSWGLGILYNSGDDINSDFGNNVDGAFFETRVFGHQLTPGMTVSYSGPTGRGGGLGKNGDSNAPWLVAEGSNRYDLDPSDNVYNLYLSFARKDSPSDIQMMLADDRSVWNYGILGNYRFQINDSQYFKLNDGAVSEFKKGQIYRGAHLGIASLWSKLQMGHLYVEAEAAGIFGQVGNGLGLWADPTRQDAIWVYQGGVALESRYGFMQDRLQLGLDAGWASGDPNPGFGLRPGLNKDPVAGAADGQQFSNADNAITNFRFDRDYHVDMLLFREVLGAVTDAFYLKPHIAYYFTDNLGLRGDVIGSMSNFASSTPGNNQILGLELDASVFAKTDDGFFFNLQYGYLFPFAGLGYEKTNPIFKDNPALYTAYGTPSSASAIRLMAGVTF